MGRIREIILSDKNRLLLDAGYVRGKSHAFRKRCQLVLLKSEGRSSVEVATILKMHQASVNAWLNRYEAEGIEGLHTKPGRGRKPVLCKEQHGLALMEAVKKNRQSLRATKVAFEQSRSSDDPAVSEGMLRRFLKALTVHIKE